MTNGELGDVIARADLDRIYQDWGRTAVLNESVRTFDPETGLLDEVDFGVDVQVIAMEDHVRQLVATSANAPIAQKTFLIRRASVPTHLVLESASLCFEGRKFLVQRVTESSLADVLALACVVANGDSA